MNPNESNETPLQSWKEIAAYLQRNEVTARRWEKGEGLPIHRHTHQRGSSVYAFRSEIDAWRVSRKAVPEPEPPRPLWKMPAFAVTMAMCLVMVGNGLRPQVVSAQSAPVNRLVWTLPKDGQITSHTSRSGRFVPFVHWGKYGDIYLHDLVSGTDRQLTDGGKDAKPGAETEEFASELALSRDDSKLAYTWYRSDHDRAELRVLSITANGIPTFRTLYDSPEAEWVSPTDWSPDGKWVAVQVLHKDQTIALGVVDSERGTLRVLKSVDWRGSNRMVFSPDGKFLAYDLPPTDESENRDVFVMAVDGSRESAVVAHPAHDTLIDWREQSLVFASDRGDSMGLWSQHVVDGKPQGAAELLKADVGSSWESMGLTSSGALFSVRADVQNVYNVQTASVDLRTGKLTSQPQDAVSTFMGSNRMPVWSPNGAYLAYLRTQIKTGMKRFVLGIRSTETGVVREIVPSPNFREVKGLDWAPDGKSLLVAGYAKGTPAVVQVDLESGKSQVLATDALFVGVMGAGGNKLYYIWQGFGPDGKNFYRALMEKDLTTGKVRELVRRPNLTNIFASPDGKWVTVGLAPKQGQGTTDILVFPTAGGESRVLFSKGDAQAVNMFSWMPDSRSLRIRRVLNPQTVELWDVPLDGTAPAKLATSPRGGLAPSFRLHPDGKRIAFEARAVQKPAEVWALENFLPGK